MSGPAPRGVLRVGDRVCFDGELHTVASLTGAQARLASDAGEVRVVLVAHLLSASDFELVAAEPTLSLPPFALVEGLPERLSNVRGCWNDT